MGSLEKLIKEGKIFPASSLPPLMKYRTGILGLDIALLGGIPAGGALTLLWGEEGSGKTFLAYKIAQQVQRVGGKVLWVDLERSFDPTWAMACGVDLGGIDLSVPSYLEEGLEAALAGVGEYELVVLDSLQGAAHLAEVERLLEQDSYGGGAKVINRWVAKIGHAGRVVKNGEGVERSKTALVAMAQMRASLSQYGSPWKLPGGHGLRHMAMVILQLRRAKVLVVEGKESERRPYGVQIQWHVVKSKVSPLGKEGVFTIYTQGVEDGVAGEIDLWGEILTWGSYYGVFERHGGWYHYGGEKFKGREAVILGLEGKREELEAEILGVGIEQERKRVYRL